jgi:hypothetical protein
VAPLEVSVTELPEQITLLDVEAVTVGLGVTSSVNCAVDEQNPLLPVTV